MTRRGAALAAGAAVLALAVAARLGATAPELLIEAPPELAPVVEEVRRIGEGDFSAALYLTGRMGFAAPIRVILAPAGGELDRRTPAWVSGFADGATRTVVLFPARLTSYPDDSLRTLVHHEVAHVLVDEAARGRRVPRWFNEGIATVAAREWGIEDRARFAMAVVGRGPRTTAELDAAFEAGGRRVARAYAMSAAFVRWLRAEHGEHVTARILELVGRDLPFPEAFVRATGVPLVADEHRFFVREALWHTWVPFLTSSGALWAAITALALIAIRRRRRKSALMRRRWELEEELETSRTPSSLPTGLDRRRSVEDSDDEVVN